jgi:hypothetical protein
MPDSSHPLPRNVLDAIQRGNLVEAIKLLREQTGLGLKEAKDLVDSQVGASGPARGGWSLPLPPAAAAAWQQGNEIEAIRLLRAETGLGLKEARQLVEGSFPSPGEVPRSRTGLGWLAAAAIMIVIVVYLAFQRAT